MSKFIYVVCDKEGIPFSSTFSRTWAFEYKEDAENSCNPDEHVVKYKACKIKEE